MAAAYPIRYKHNAWVFIGAQSLSFIASVAIPVIISFALLDAHYSGYVVGKVLAITDLPFVFLLLFGGVLADKFKRRKIAMTTEAVRAIIAFAIAVVLREPHFTPLDLEILGAASGVARAFFAPTLTGMTSEIFEVSALNSANSFREGARSLGNLAGPILGGVGVAVIGASGAMWIIAGFYLASSILLFSLSTQDVSNQSSPDRDEHQKPVSVIRDLLHGFNEVKSQAWCWVVIAVYTAMHLFVFGPMLVLGPLIAKLYLGGPAIWGMILASDGIGGIVGAALALRIRFTRPLWTSSIIVLGGAPALFLLANHYAPYLIAISLGFFGAGLSFIGVNWETALQHYFPPESISRVSAFDLFGSVALFPLGQALGGVSTKYMSVGNAIVISGIILIALSLVLLFSRAVFNLQIPNRSPS